MNHLLSIALMIMLFPLLGAVIAGLAGKMIGRRATHCITIFCVGVAFVLSSYLCADIIMLGKPIAQGVLYRWITSGSFHIDIALLVDRLSVSMACIVTFVSLMVHVYTVGYMRDDPGYQRFFAYMSLFTFAMLTLVFANNFLLLFFGWEGVGLVSYLLIGFWFKRESANQGSLKAFIVNRVGDMGFILGVAGILLYFGTLDYQTVFANVPKILDQTITLWPHQPISAITLICVTLFIGAMAKSAQVPLHVWLPESMEGPTPISALIHAATMVTAGIYMVARLSPLFEYSQFALSMIIVLGATTCFFMGLLAVFNQDIKRVIAYSTISQLGYMAVALGTSAYDAAIFHLFTHAFFKALLFLAAGSVIIALHHEQDMRKMGGLASYLPVTYLTFLIGALALSAIPPFAGFYSKDAIIEAAQLSTIPGATYAYWCVLAGAFVTPLYIFRALFLTFHGKERMDHEVKEHVRESPWVVLIPLLFLSIPSIFAGSVLVGSMLFSKHTLLGDTIFVLPQHNVLQQMALHFEGAKEMAIAATHTLTFWLAVAGIGTAWFFTLRAPEFAEQLKRRYSFLYMIMQKKYGFDEFYQWFFVKGSCFLGNVFYKVVDLKIIDGLFVNGSGKVIQWFSRITRRVQTGSLYHYAFVMMIGLLAFLGWLLVGLK